jgi:hypothetical protein
VGFAQTKLFHPLRELFRLSLLHAHSLRCGLEEFRQLRWLNIPNPRDFRSDIVYVPSNKAKSYRLIGRD